jgi:hypothetical protein
MGAKRIGEPTKRHIIGRIFNFIVKLSILPGFEDTQCGFKMFTAEAAEKLFRVQKLGGIGFDIELIFLAKKASYSIKEIPITWYFDPDSRIKLINDSLRALVEIAEIHISWIKGEYKV